MSNSMEEKRIMECFPLSPLSSEPEPNCSEQLVEPPPQTDSANELVKSSPKFAPITDALVESPLQSDPIANELAKSSRKFDTIVDELEEFTLKSGPIANVIEPSQKSDSIADESDPITSELVESSLKFEPTTDELVESFPKSDPIVDEVDPIANELVKSSLKLSPIADELVKSQPQSDPIANDLVDSPAKSKPIANELLESISKSNPTVDEFVESNPQFDPTVNESVESIPHSNPNADEKNEVLPTVKGGRLEASDVMMAPKKKRGRPWKYEVDDEMVFASSGSNSEGTSKSATSRPKGSNKKLQRLGTNETGATGNSFPMALTVQTGEDLLTILCALAERTHQPFCILSANGVVSNPLIYHPTSALKYEGCYEIIRLAGSFLYYPKKSSVKLSIALANPDNTVFGGQVLLGAPLRAASPIQLILGALKQEEELNDHLNLIRMPSGTPSAELMPNHAVDQYGIRAPFPPPSPHINNSRDGTPIRYRRPTFNLNNLP